MDKINAFFDSKMATKCETYDLQVLSENIQVTNYATDGNNIEKGLSEFREDLEVATIEMK